MFADQHITPCLDVNKVELTRTRLLRFQLLDARLVMIGKVAGAAGDAGVSPTGESARGIAAKATDRLLRWPWADGDREGCAV
jgi:hypothetical protein